LDGKEKSQQTTEGEEEKITSKLKGKSRITKEIMVWTASGKDLKRGLRLTKK